jgi:hypothetical protein
MTLNKVATLGVASMLVVTPLIAEEFCSHSRERSLHAGQFFGLMV